MSYESPIELITKSMVHELDNLVYKAVVNCGVRVDKDQLIRALDYDRRQYEKGYKDGLHDSDTIPIDWIIRYTSEKCQKGSAGHFLIEEMLIAWRMENEQNNKENPLL